jgi:outer membrane protein TolC
MLVFRHLVVVSAGAVFALGYGVPAISQESLTVDSSADSSADRSVDESPSLGSSHFSSNINFSPSAVTEKLNKNSISKVGEREAQSAETRERVVLDKTRNLNGTEEINPEEINPDETSFPDVTLNASEAPEAAIIKPVVPADSALELSWEADIPQLTPEITEDLAQNPSIPETSRSPELLANETFLLSQEEVDLEPSPDRLDSENENEEDNPETIVDEVSPLLEEPSIRGRQVIPPPENLNPSANPLLFPTEPDEVTIDLSQPITLDQAIALARRNNQDWRKAWLNLEKADAALREALAANFPSLSAEINLSRTDSATTELSNRRLRNRGLSASTNSTATNLVDGTLQLSYTLYDGGSRPAQIRQAEETVRFNQLEIERVVEELQLNTANAYYALQQSDATVGIELSAVEAAKQTLRDAELLEQAGLGTRFDVLRAQVELANSQQNLVNARADGRIAKRQLVQVLALGEQVEVTIADQIERAGDWDLSLENTIVLAYRNRAELEQQLVQREIDEQQRQVALSVLRPQVSLFANYNVANILNFGEGFADGYAIGATLSWTLFDGGAAQANSRQEELDIEIAETNFEQQRKSIRVEVEEAYENLTASDENINTAIVAVQLAEESLRLARLRFQAGVGTQTDVIDAQTELTRSRGNLLTATVGYNRALVALQRAVSNVPDNRLFDLP